ncbi:MAG: hypothetical protein KTR35_01700 [Gammaproteobacteria bacterium]|nr:hypothetical protein [Gammaproteobacteria bacterium]
MRQIYIIWICFGSMLLVACGNKGDLYLQSETAVSKEVEDIDRSIDEIDELDELEELEKSESDTADDDEKKQNKKSTS